MSASYSASIEELSRIPGVRAAMVVDLEAGVPVVSEVQTGVDDIAVAALASSLLRRAERAVRAPGYGNVQCLQLESENGHLVAAASGEVAVVALADRDAQIGLIRIRARSSAEMLA